MLSLVLACTGTLPEEDGGNDGTDTAALAGLATSIDPLAAEVDECEEVCFTVTVTQDGDPAFRALVDVWAGEHVVVADQYTDKDGRVQACVGGLDAGTYTLWAMVEDGEARAQANASLAVHGFGWVDGIERDSRAIEELPWIPSFIRVGDDPVLPKGDEGTWDEVGTIVPSVAKTDAGWVMWYAGTAEVDYVLGSASSRDGMAWEKNPDNPSFPNDNVEGSWKRYSTNSPMILQVDDTWYMYYTGRADEEGNLTIGLATGADPESLTDVPGNPVFSWSEEEVIWGGEAVAHPSVLVNENGWFEMWYSTGYHRVGYAYSADGLDWKRYCHNPVFVGDTSLDWENNMVKANEVVVLDGWYMMTYTGGDTGAFEVGWAMSRDGLHWIRSEDPVLLPVDEGGTWQSTSVLSAPIVVDGDELKMWYSGTGASQSAVGYAVASLAGAP